MAMADGIHSSEVWSHHFANNWRALCTYFAMIFQVAWNPLKFGMPTLFVPVFFQEGRKIWTKLQENPPLPPPPSLSVSKQCRISILESQNTLRVCFTLLEGGGGGGGIFKNMFEALFPCLWKKYTDILLTQKELACQISADSEQLEKLQGDRYIVMPLFNGALHLLLSLKTTSYINANSSCKNVCKMLSR